MKYNHENDYFYKYTNEFFTIQHNFSNDLGSGETLSSCTASIFDSSGTDKTASMISSVSVSSPSTTFKVDGGTSGETYEIKIVGVGSGSNRYINFKTCEVYDSITINTKLGDPTANSYVTLKEANDYIRNIRGRGNVWDTLSIEGKKRVLIEACRQINMFNFVGEKYYNNQALEFPRDDHDVVSGDVATPITISSFKNTGFTSDSYGSNKSNTNYWKYGTIHITSATPLYDIRNISTNNITTDVVTVDTNFSATPTTNTDFIAFEPLPTAVKHAQCEQALYLVDNSGNDTYISLRESGVKSQTIGDTSISFTDGSMVKISLSSTAKKLLSTWIRRTKVLHRA